VIIDFSIGLPCGSVVLDREDAAAASGVFRFLERFLLPFNLAMLAGVVIRGAEAVAWLLPVSVGRASAA
jgi:hypothetical protein